MAGIDLGRWQSLTKSEAVVLALVAEGLSNPAIAERLGHRTRTIENHLNTIYLKLDIPTDDKSISYRVVAVRWFFSREATDYITIALPRLPVLKYAK